MHGLADEQKKISAGGDFPDIMLYDESGRYIGRNKGGKEDHPAIPSGGYDEVTITHNKGRNGLAATYCKYPFYVPPRNPIILVDEKKRILPGSSKLPYIQNNMR